MYKTYYLNNKGSRWVIRDNSNNNIRVIYNNVSRRAKYFESFGNFVLVAINYKGKLIKTLGYRITND